jgi:RsiW-degrading membrane proteinase PrsW (M82 family)
MRPRVLIALFLFLILMGVLGFAPIHLHEQIDDKVLHFSIFFILAVLLYFLWNLSVNRNMILATTTLLILAVGSELIQGLLPVRCCYNCYVCATWTNES